MRAAAALDAGSTTGARCGCRAAGRCAGGRRRRARPEPATRPGCCRAAGPTALGLALLLVVLFLAVAGGACPVVRRLTRRLEALKQGVEAFGAGALHQRVAEDGHDEVAALGASFNRAAARIEALLRSHQSLLANASHELRSPLARLKMAVAMIDDAPPAQRAALRSEIDTNIAELDALVEEVLLASRLDAAAVLDVRDAVALLRAGRRRGRARGCGGAGRRRAGARATNACCAAPCATCSRTRAATAAARSRPAPGAAGPAGGVELRVCDRGPGVPEAYRERIFEAFFRLPGHAEREGGVGLGLTLVRQIAQRHGGSVRCEPRDGGGSCFVLELPVA